MSLRAGSEAAEHLGVSTRQVQHLVARGKLRQVARFVLDGARASDPRLKGRLHRLSATELVERARDRAEATHSSAHSGTGQASYRGTR